MAGILVADGGLGFVRGVANKTTKVPTLIGDN